MCVGSKIQTSDLFSAGDMVHQACFVWHVPGASCPNHSIMPNAVVCFLTDTAGVPATRRDLVRPKENESSEKS